MRPDIFSQIFENSPVAMLLVDQASKICLVNRHANKLFGYATNELVGQPVEILVPAAARSKHPALVADYFQAPSPRQMGRGRNLFGVKKDGTEFPLEVGLNPIQSGPDRFVMSSIIDLSQRVEAENRFQAAVEAAPNGMLMINAAGTIVLTNRKTQEMFGYTKEELIHQPIDLLVPDDFKAPHPSFVRGYFADPKPRAMGIGRELFGRRKDGTLIPVEIGLQPIEADKKQFVISSILDISHRRAADISIKEKTEELEQFAYRTSHDLKTPLITIRGLAECVIEDSAAKDYAEVAVNADKIMGITAKLQKLVQTMLSMTKTDLKNEEQSAFDFSELIDSFKDKYYIALNDSRVAFDVSLSHRVDLLTQPTRMAQILENLLANAVKYCDPGKESCYVNLKTFNDLEMFHIHIEDNGMGIPDHRQHDVFDMFTRFHEASAEGSGLGLYMVHRHITKIGGKISFSSSPAGTTFYLAIPLQKRASPPIQQAPSCPAGF